MHSVSGSFYSTVLTNVRSSFPTSHPMMESPIADSVSFPIPNISEFIFFTIENTYTFAATNTSVICSNIGKYIFTHLAGYNDLAFTLICSALDRTEYPSIWSGREHLSAHFTVFDNHILHYSI